LPAQTIKKASAPAAYVGARVRLGAPGGGELYEVTRDLGDRWELRQLGERRARQAAPRRVRPAAHRGEA